MDMKSKLEQVLELMINEESEQATELLHNIFVETSRRIYSEVINEDVTVEEAIEEDIDAGDQEEDFIKDIEASEDEIEAEEMYSEDEDEATADEDEIESAEADLADEMHSDADEEFEADHEEMEAEEEAEEKAEAEEEVEDAFVNVEDSLAELKASFAELLDAAEDAVEADADAEEAEEEAMEMPMEEVEAVDEAEETLEEGMDFGKEAKADVSDKADSKESTIKGKAADMVEPEGEPVEFAGDVEGEVKAEKATELKVTKPQDGAEMRSVKA